MAEWTKRFELAGKRALVLGAGGAAKGIVAKLEALPLESTLTKFGNAADEIAVTVKDVRGTLDEAEAMLADLTLDEALRQRGEGAERRRAGSHAQQQLDRRQVDPGGEIRVLAVQGIADDLDGLGGLEDDGLAGGIERELESRSKGRSQDGRAQG